MGDRPFSASAVVILVDEQGLSEPTYATSESVIPAGVNHHWRVRGGLDTPNGITWSKWSGDMVIGTNSESEVAPVGMSLDVYPNPSGGRASIRYSVGEAAPVGIRVVDATGRILQLVSYAFKTPGHYQKAINTAGWTAGVYFCVLESAGRVVTRSLLVVR